MSYQLYPTGNDVVRLADNAIIPFDELNVDYQKYKQWLEEGNTPLEAETNEEIEI